MLIIKYALMMYNKVMNAKSTPQYLMQPLIISGKSGEAYIYTNSIDHAAQKQIQMITNSKMAVNAHIRIMPDVHAGVNCVIGYTAKLSKYVVPDLIGTDIGCGVCCQRLQFNTNQMYLNDQKRKQFFEQLDEHIHKNIPCQHVKNEVSEPELKIIFTKLFQQQNFKTFISDLQSLEKKLQITSFQSLGTLGGGNHFIEVDEGLDTFWVTVHSGSRDLGKAVAEFYIQKSAEFEYEPEALFEQVKAQKKVIVATSYQDMFTQFLQQKDKKNHKKLLEYVQFQKLKSNMPFIMGKLAEDYYADMKIAQMFASLNRGLMLASIQKFCEQFQQDNKLQTINIQQSPFSYVESIHNYIDFQDGLIRKGAIAARKDEPLIIPLNMKDGVLLGVGKSNPEWNCSAPHGAGRLLRRSDVASAVTMEQFKTDMEGIYTTCVAEGTLDECPRAYKSSEDIIEWVQETMVVSEHLKSVYNFKAGGEGE